MLVDRIEFPRIAAKEPSAECRAVRVAAAMHWSSGETAVSSERGVAAIPLRGEALPCFVDFCKIQYREGHAPRAVVTRREHAPSPGEIAPRASPRLQYHAGQAFTAIFFLRLTKERVLESRVRHVTRRSNADLCQDSHRYDHRMHAYMHASVCTLTQSQRQCNQLRDPALHLQTDTPRHRCRGDSLPCVPRRPCPQPCAHSWPSLHPCALTHGPVHSRTALCTP